MIRRLFSLSKQIRLSRKMHMPIWPKGRLLRMLGKYREALAILDDAMRLDPNDVEADLEKAMTFEQAQQYEDAVSAYEAAIAFRSWLYYGLAKQSKYRTIQMNSAGVLPDEKRIMASCLCAHRVVHVALINLSFGCSIESTIRFKLSLNYWRYPSETRPDSREPDAHKGHQLHIATCSDAPCGHQAHGYLAHGLSWFAYFTLNCT